MVRHNILSGQGAVRRHRCVISVISGRGVAQAASLPLVWYAWANVLRSQPRSNFSHRIEAKAAMRARLRRTAAHVESEERRA